MTLLQNLPYRIPALAGRFITSQGDTAPKLVLTIMIASSGFITSQGDTAPKHNVRSNALLYGFITSQGDTAPKLLRT